MDMRTQPLESLVGEKVVYQNWLNGSWADAEVVAAGMVREFPFVDLRLEDGSLAREIPVEAILDIDVTGELVRVASPGTRHDVEAVKLG